MFDCFIRTDDRSGLDFLIGQLLDEAPEKSGASSVFDSNAGSCVKHRTLDQNLCKSLAVTLVKLLHLE